LDSIGLGGMTVTPFLISNNSSTDDAVFFQIMIYELLIIPVFPRLKGKH